MRFFALLNSLGEMTKQKKNQMKYLFTMSYRGSGQFPYIQFLSDLLLRNL